MSIHRVCIAPLLHYTDAHYRMLMRLLTRHTFLYTEMIPVEALLHKSPDLFLPLVEEHPVGLQLMGEDPTKMARAAKIASDLGYDEININVGCPSHRVAQGGFGIVLLKQIPVLCEMIRAMKEAARVPVTIKTRLALEEGGNCVLLKSVLPELIEAGCNTFMVHARVAKMENKRPKDNRNTLPLNYESVYALKREFPACTFVLNGGIKTIETMQEALKQLDGVMLGQAAYRNPYLFSEIDRLFFDDAHPVLTREEAIDQYEAYLTKHVRGERGKNRARRHLIHLFYGVPNASSKYRAARVFVEE